MVIFRRRPARHRLVAKLPMRRLTQVVALLLVSWTLFLATPPASAQQSDSDSQRKVVNRVVPTYPPLAKEMNVRGAVRLEALVEPNGRVKTVAIKGGHPLLVQAAESAVKKWKWAPAKQETREDIEIRFNPDD
jgi:TonB family protein